MNHLNFGTNMAAATEETEPTRLLPEDYEPGENTVIIGRGKRCVMHEGNKRLRKIVVTELSTYQSCRSKMDKSIVLVCIVRKVCSKNKDNVGFVKQDLDTHRWHTVTEVAARISVAQVFRDTLCNDYKSSRQSKQQKRQLEKQQKGMCTPLSPPSLTLESGLTMKLSCNNGARDHACDIQPRLSPFLGRAPGFSASLPRVGVEGIITSAINMLEGNEQSWDSMSNATMHYGPWNTMQASFGQVASPRYSLGYPNQGGYFPVTPCHTMVDSRAQSAGPVQDYSASDIGVDSLMVEPLEEAIEPLPLDGDDDEFDGENAGEEPQLDLFEVFSSIPLRELKAALK
jgi:hypothetical protein